MTRSQHDKVLGAISMALAVAVGVYGIFVVFRWASDEPANWPALIVISILWSISTTAERLELRASPLLDFLTAQRNSNPPLDNVLAELAKINAGVREGNRLIAQAIAIQVEEATRIQPECAALSIAEDSMRHCDQIFDGLDLILRRATEVQQKAEASRRTFHSMDPSIGAMYEQNAAAVKILWEMSPEARLNLLEEARVIAIMRTAKDVKQ